MSQWEWQAFAGGRCRWLDPSVDLLHDTYSQRDSTTSRLNHSPAGVDKQAQHCCNALVDHQVLVSGPVSSQPRLKTNGPHFPRRLACLFSSCEPFRSTPFSALVTRSTFFNSSCTVFPSGPRPPPPPRCLLRAPYSLPQALHSRSTRYVTCPPEADVLLSKPFSSPTTLDFLVEQTCRDHQRLAQSPLCTEFCDFD
ncbi:hypothetical protein IQ07DRAFT_201568 [Pyrenochaeta sp. DS3sAY3a]|nr:hypothetical protein IQ07DRAFT_201568 [Pyrenochaeta sp. DS3sAY3a]